MAGPIATYLMIGLFFLLITNHDYRKQAKPSLIQIVGFAALCVFCWPWLVWMMARSNP